MQIQLETPIFASLKQQLFRTMKRIIIALLILVSASTIQAEKKFPTSFRMQPNLTTQDYLAKTVVLKVKDTYRQACSTNAIELQKLQGIFQSIGVTSVKKIFPNHQPPATPYNDYGFKYADLSLIYKLEYTADVNLVKVINSLLHTGLLEYAEPKYIPYLSYNPNDPQTGSQTFLTRINAYSGWDVWKGDTNTVIGIVDTGSDLDHPDLLPNLKINYNDPINGIDDDNDGYIDNYNGWDLAENDNDATVPTCNNCEHGSHVSGCAAAATDNNIGVAGPGFFCKFLPVKIAITAGTLTVPYEGITYAADHGCQIINCSWGGGGGGVFGQDVIDYATINKNALVVVAAGNNNSSALFYPAAYNYVLCVAATNSNNDVKASFSNYGTYIDVCAPGNGIFTTVYNDSYTSLSGTSMASPITAGVAAIVKSYFPSYNALQVGEQVRITTDNIYGLTGNSAYQDKLGSGRINMLNALTLTGESVRMNPIVFSDHGDDIFLPGDTMFITGDITQFLDPATSLNLTLTSTSPYVTIVDGYTFVGALGTMATTNNLGDPFIVKIAANAPLNTVITFKLLINDGSYNDFQLFNKTVNVDYVDITINDVWTSNTSKGSICYNGDNQSEGLGFDFLNEGTLTYECSFMTGIATSVSDNFRGASGIDHDFQSQSKIVKVDPGILSDFDTYGQFDDSNNPTALGLTINHRSYSWAAPPNTKFHIFEYTLINNGNNVLSNLYAGIINDWDIQNASNNKAAEDFPNRLGYVWSTDVNGYYAGTRLLTPTPFQHYAIDNNSTGSGGVNVVNGGFSGTEKYTVLSTNRPTAGGTGTGNDVFDMVSTGPFTLNIGDSVTVAYALLAGVELTDLVNSATLAQIQYDALTTGTNDLSSLVNNVKIYPNPANNELNLYYNLQEKTFVNIAIYDLSGRIVADLNHIQQVSGFQSFKFNTGMLKDGFYLLEISTPNGNHIQKLTIAH